MAYRAGQKLGNYQLERLLGRGGFAEVYLGKHIYLNTYAAIKVLQRQMNDEAHANFLREARIIASLQHPHIVSVLEFGIEERHPFLVMAYAPQGTLRRRYRKDQILSPALIAPHIRQIADALYYAHTRKIIHRDIKPENMLLDDDNNVLLSDFGLAMQARSTYRSIHSTDSAGTTIYMAPEQLQGRPGAASDQYALGVIMYEWMCGCLPFDGPDISVVVQHLHELPIPPRKHVPTIPEQIEGIILRALEKDPQQRFANVQELASAFEKACKDISIPVVAAEMLQRTPSEHEDVAMGELQQKSLTGASEELWIRSVQSNIQLSVASPEPSQAAHPAFLQAPSLSASLKVSTSTQDTNVEEIVSTALSRQRASISRRTMLAGIAGIGVLLGGVSIWRFSSQEAKTLPLRSQGGQKNPDPVTSSRSAIKRTPTKHASGTPNIKRSPKALPTDGNVVGKNVAPSTPSSFNTAGTSHSGQPTATSIPGVAGSPSSATPTATTPAAAPSVGLTVYINNPPSSVQDGATTYISVTTNMGNIPFQFNATYTGLKNQSANPDVSNGTTDGRGTGSVPWTPSFPPGHVVSGTYADISVIATDANGNNVSSQPAQVQITRQA